MDLTKNFEVLNFPYSDIIPGKVSTCKLLSFLFLYFKKCKDQKTLKFEVLSFSADFLQFLPSKLIVL